MSPEMYVKVVKRLKKKNPLFRKSGGTEYLSNDSTKLVQWSLRDLSTSF